MSKKKELICYYYHYQLIQSQSPTTTGVLCSAVSINCRQNLVCPFGWLLGLPAMTLSVTTNNKQQYALGHQLPATGTRCKYSYSYANLSVHIPWRWAAGECVLEQSQQPASPIQQIYTGAFNRRTSITSLWWVVGWCTTACLVLHQNDVWDCLTWLG